jgi:outer membrane lipoprotein LolB
MHRVGVCLLLAFLLAGCAVPRPLPTTEDPQAAYEARVDQLTPWRDWYLTGRLGVSLGDEGGSGRLDWRQAGDDTELQFRGALGQGAWRLEARPGFARIERGDGAVREAVGVDELVRAETGWQLPVVPLAWWVRGMAWPGGEVPAELSLNEDGTPRALVQAGWRVEFDRYESGPGDRVLPTRLDARRGDVRVKLAVSRWVAPGEKQGG